MASAARALQRRAVVQAHQPIGPDGLLLTQLFPWPTGTALAPGSVSTTRVTSRRLRNQHIFRREERTGI